MLVGLLRNYSYEKKGKNKKKGGKKKGFKFKIRRKKLQSRDKDKISTLGKIRFEGILRRERVCCSEHGAIQRSLRGEHELHLRDGGGARVSVRGERRAF